MKNNIYVIRKEKNLTLKQLSVLTNLSIGYLCHLENGTRVNPSMNTMAKICTALDASLSDVFNV
ncbi:MAG: helix-turn-helix transcriptional regulator [Clostridiales bacterium]|nr:helix-turn-helix transcriptional regulator [Clostridiales bacterium]